MNSLKPIVAVVLFALMAPLAASAQRADISCQTTSGAADDGIAYSYTYRLNLYRQHSTDGINRYVALVTEIEAESGRRASESVRVREGSAVVAFNDSEELQLSITLDRTTPPQPFGRHLTLMVPARGGAVTGRLWDDGLLAACLTGNRGLEACLGELSRNLRCRIYAP